MKSIKAQLKHRMGKLLVMDKPPSPSSSTNRRNAQQSTNRSRANEFQDPPSADSSKHRLFWGSRRNSTAGKDERRSKADVSLGGKKKPPQPTTPRQSTYTQTDMGRGRSNRKRNTRCLTVGNTALNSRDTIRSASGHRKPEELTARCSATHEGRKLLQERLMVRVDALFNILFSASPFLQSFHERRRSTDLRMGGWARNSAGQNERKVSVTVALQSNVGPKTVKVTETQVMRECSQPGQLYSIDVYSVNAEIPYADAFVVLLHFCLRATVEEYTDVLVFGQVKFLKSVWAVVKAFIEKNTYAGLEEFCQSLYSALLIEIKKM
ncbi:protein Aster-A isoform X2 [Drosophila gunungcola]|uniref:protein Aster-A isoform X2 n=1 Tax=Drosophila gunungcola TaxID=103775 RepID=UPI0022E1D584|nr:protein Aster-A isoform X2 [Drosophila gunungcola]